MLLSPHKSVESIRDKRLHRLVIIMALVAIPWPLLAFYLRHHSYDEQLKTTLMVEIGTTLVIAFNYVLLRSRYFQIAFGFAVAVGFIAPLIHFYSAPSYGTSPTGNLLPVLLAALLFGSRGMLIAFFVGLGSLALVYLSIEEVERWLIVKHAIVYSLTSFLILLLSKYQVWLNQYDSDVRKDLEQRYTKLAQSSYDGTASVIDGRIERASDGLAQIVNLEPKELIGRHTADLFDDSQVLENQQNLTLKLKGKQEYVQVSSSRLNDNEILLAVRHLVGERVKHLQQLQTNRFAETGLLASGLAHELNTPLMVALNQSRYALQGLPKDAVEVKQRLVSLEKSLNQITEIVKDLRWFVKEPKHDEPTYPSYVIEQTLKIMRSRLRPGSSIVTQLNAESPIRISQHGLAQLLINLVNNALEAQNPSRTGVSIRIETETDDRVFSLKVIDDGIGMTTETLARAFEPFYSVNKPNGTGLGLALCQDIVMRAEGQISAKSTPHHGTEILITLPLSRQTVDVSNKSTIVYEKVEGLLVVDDDEALAQTLGENISKGTFWTATDIDDAIRLVDEKEIKLIICDVNMPCGGAKKLYRRLFEMNHSLVNSLVVMTGDSVSPTTQAFLEYSPLKLLQKPFSDEQVLKMIHEMNASFTDETPLK